MKQILSIKRKENQWFVLKIILSVLLLFSLHTLHAQNIGDKKITIPVGKTTGSAVINSIKEQVTEARFTYDEATSNKLAGEVNVTTADLTVKQALTLLEKSFGIISRIDAHRIMLSQPAQQSPASPNASAGQGTGAVKGRIVEFETSDPLPGATVRIVGTNIATQSNESGYYQLNSVPAGNHTLEVSFIGYAIENVSVNINANREATYDVRLQGDNTLEEVTISAIAKTRRPVAHTSNQQLVTEIKEMSVVASGISSQQISMSADRNAAEVIQRIAGVTVVDDRFAIIRGLNPRYNLTYLNDNVAPSTEVNSRAFALDLIPSRVIDKVLVYKSPSPEYQGDATGGVLKVYTKDARAVRYFDVELQLGWREGTTFQPDILTYKGGKTDFLGFDDGTRALPGILPGYGSLVKAKLAPSQYAAAMNPTLGYTPMTALPNMQLTANYYDAWRVAGKTLSSLTSFSYKNETNKRLVDRQEGTMAEGGYRDRMGIDNVNTQTAQMNLLQNFTFALDDRNRFFFKNFLLQQGQSGTNLVDRLSTSYHRLETFEVNDIYNTAYVDRSIILSYRQRFLYAGNLGGTHTLDTDKRHRLDWNGGYTFSRQYMPDQRITRMDNQDYFFLTGGENKPDSYILDNNWQAKGFYKLGGANHEDNYYGLTQGTISRTWSRNSEGIYNGNIDYTFEVAPWLTAKAGTFHQWKERNVYRRVYTLLEGSIANPDNAWAMPDYTKQDARLIHFLSEELPDVWSSTYLNDDYTGYAVHDRTKGSDSYIGTEQYNAGYIAATLTPLPWVELHGGMRYEYNRQKIAAAISPDPFGGRGTGLNEPVLVDNPMNSWLPSASLILRPDEQWVFRAAYGKTLNRTEMYEVSPFTELNYETNTQIQGNASLISSTASNYDIRLEFYPRPDKADGISVGVFHKDIQNPIERINTSNRISSMFATTSFRNATRAKLKGLEIEFRQSFDFIPVAFVRNLSFAGNASWIHSSATFDDVEPGDFLVSERPLQGQVPYLINAGLYYDNAGWGSKVGLTYNTTGENIYAAGRGYKYNTLLNTVEYRGSLIELQRHLLDLSYTQRIGNGLQMKMAVQNILNEAVRMAEDFNFSNTYEPYTQAMVYDEEYGREIPRGEGDNIYSSYKPGRQITVSFSYAF